MDNLLELVLALPSDKEHEIEQKVAAVKEMLAASHVTFDCVQAENNERHKS
jgi:hypothetical protein